LGKSSEAKSKRRNKRKVRISNNKKVISEKSVSRFMGVSNEFDNYSDCIKNLVSLFLLYKPEDVIVALCISDIWLPNISSSVKHQLAYRVLASMNENDFLEKLELDTYEKFYTFIGQVYSLIPHNPMIEDFVPEQDWGDVKFKLNGCYYQIFYGGNVERIIDFLDAFKIYNSENVEAMADLKVVLQLQDHLISLIPSVDKQDFNSGHVEIPEEIFWKQTLNVLSNMDGYIDEISTQKSGLSLFTHLGGMDELTGEDSIGNLTSTGDLFKTVGLVVKGKYYIASPRNIASVVLDLWSSGKIKNSSENLILIDSFNDYLLSRYSVGSFVKGPLVLQTPTEIFPYTFSTLAQSNDEAFLFLLSSYDDIETTVGVRKQLNDFVSHHKSWRLLNFVTGEGVELRNVKGEYFPIDKIKVIIVLSNVSTEMVSVPEPGKGSLLFSMPDFVTVFDSFESIDELSKFNDYVDTSKEQLFNGFTGMSDLYASFRQTDEVLLAGATTFDYVMLDTFIGSDWRYKNVKNYWDYAPLNFPQDMEEWSYKQSDSENLYSFNSRSYSRFCWSAIVGGCAVHFLFSFDGIGDDLVNGKLIELACNCFADSLVQRRKFIESIPIFRFDKVVISCKADMENLATNDESNFINVDSDIFSDWKKINESDSELTLDVKVNLNCIQSNVFKAVDSSFEYRSVIEICNLISNLSNIDISDLMENDELLETSSLKPRFYQGVIDRAYDVPEFSTSQSISAKYYKLARKELAYLFKAINITPGKYELFEAKNIIDEIRGEFKNVIHSELKKFKRNDLLRYCIKQIDMLSAEYDLTIERITQSLKHDVDFNREVDTKEAYDRFSRYSRNFRYLLENRLYFIDEGTDRVDHESISLCIGKIDWLFVLYGSSDTLHNGIDVGGVEIDDDYIPTVFFSEGRSIQEDAFTNKMARNRLGVGQVENDRLEPSAVDLDIKKLNEVFLEDVGFSLSNMLGVLTVLAEWYRRDGNQKSRWFYEASYEELIEIIQREVPDLYKNEILRIIEFLVLDPGDIRKLLGKGGVEESDVPVWEHFNRGSRYSIKPLVRMNENAVMWGAASVHKSKSIWGGNITSGYLPADFDWVGVKSEVDRVKVGLENKLEKISFEIFERHLKYRHNNLDFKRRFKSEKFDDVGDFDVLAYMPERNTWIAVECKYNKPPRCIKDMRKLRDLIFTKKKSHVKKIERRSDFLKKHSDKIVGLLGWPLPEINLTPKVVNLYVSRDTYWWMVNPPSDVEVDIEFEQIDFLDSWLKSFIDK
jgi:hypothetical protein